MEKKTLFRHEVNAEGVAKLRAITFEDVSPNDKIFILEGMQVAVTKSRKPDTVGRAAQKSVRSGKEAKTYGTITSTDDGFSVELTLGSEMVEEIEKYRSQGRKLIIALAIPIKIESI